MLLSIRPFKCLDFKTFCVVVIYIIVAKNLFIYIKLYWGQGGASPQGAGMGQGSLPHTPGRGRDGEGQQPCGAGMKIPSSGPVPPDCHP